MPTASMHFSGPLPPVSSFSRSSTLSSSKLIVIAPPASRHVRRSGTLSMQITCFGAEQHGAADRELADRAGAPDRDRVGRLDVALHRRLPAGREDVAEEQHLLVGQAVGDLDRRDVGIGHAHVLGLAAGIAAGEVGVAEQARRWCGRTPCRRASLLRLVRSQTEKLPRRHCSHSPQHDRERHDDAVADLELLVVARRPRPPRP